MHDDRQTGPSVAFAMSSAPGACARVAQTDQLLAFSSRENNTRPKYVDNTEYNGVDETSGHVQRCGFTAVMTRRSLKSSEPRYT